MDDQNTLDVAKPVTPPSAEAPKHSQALQSSWARLWGLGHSLLVWRLTFTTDPLSRIAKLLLTGLLLYVLIGVRYVAPEWWRTFFFEGGFLDWSHWKIGL